MQPFSCPFCGAEGKRSREHVWAQWLHETPCAKNLLSGTHGERIPRPGQVLRKAENGQYRVLSENAGKFAKYLPQVTVPVCDQCNNGWMGQLEDQVKQRLGPFVIEGRTPIKLLEEDLVIIAAWAVKAWMAYALTRPIQGNPFTLDEYRRMAADHRAMERAQVWLLRSTGPYSHVGMGLTSTLVAKDPPALDAAQDNAAQGFITANGLTVYLVLEPQEFIGRYSKIYTPPQLGATGSRRIWPNPRRQYFPLDEWSPAELSGLMEFPRRWDEMMGLPTEGLTQEDARAVARAFLEGADPRQLREDWAR